MSVVDSDYEKLRRYNLSELFHAGDSGCKKIEKRASLKQAVKSASNVVEHSKLPNAEPNEETDKRA